MDGLFSRRAHFCVWVHTDGVEFSSIGSVTLFSCTRDTYKIWTLSLACCNVVVALCDLHLRVFAYIAHVLRRIIAQNILGRHHICTTKLVDLVQALPMPCRAAD